MLYKYPRTFHLPWSPGCTDDDKVMKSIDYFKGKEVVVTEKMDGENTTMYRDHIHARSTTSADHESRHYVKAIHAAMRHQIPEGYRVCGENMYATHSIKYSSLPSYFLAFSIWDGERCLSWDNTVKLCETMFIETAPVIYRGMWDMDKVRESFSGISRCGGEQEGYVVRPTEEIYLKDFSRCVGKYVRENHVTTSKHWMREEVRTNGLRI